MAKTNDEKKANQEVEFTNLVTLAMQGNSHAREHLAVRILPRVKKIVALSYGRHNDFDDVVQISMVTIFRDIEKLRNTDRFLGWMDKVTYNVVRNSGKKRIRLRALFAPSPPSEDKRYTEQTPEKEQARLQFFDKIEQHLNQISEKKRLAATMSLFFGYVDSEIAELCDCKLETAKKRIQNGRKELLDKVKKDRDLADLIDEVLP